MNSGSGLEKGAHDTFPKLLLRNRDIFSDRHAMRHKDYGIWQSWTWSDVYDQVRDFALGLSKIGLKPGEKVAILSENRPRAYWAMCAVQSIGGIPVPVYQDSVAQEISYVIEHAEVSMVLCQNQEQVDKILEISEQVRGIRHIIYDETRGLGDYDHSALTSFENVQRMGQDHLRSESDAENAWHGDIGQASAATIAVMLYTSGTTGKPKGVMLTHDNLLVSADNANRFDNISEKDEILAYLPLAWVGDHVFSYAQAFVAGFCVNCPESQETAIEDRREIGPTYFFAPPRIFENLLTFIMVRMEDAGPTKKWLFDLFMKHADKVGEAILNGDKVGLWNRIKYAIGEMVIYGPLKNRMGFSNVRVGYTAGEAIGPEIFKFYRSLGINLKQLYGQTEASVYITMQPDGEIFADTVGKGAPDVELKIDDETGEVLYRSPGVFAGYYKNEEATKDTKTAEGWVYTGDAGIFDAKGHLKIIDRAKDVGRLNDGAMFPPKYIENKLKFFPNVKEVVAYGHEQDFCSVFINIDLIAVGNWAERNNIAYASYQELAQHPDVYQMIEAHVDEVNMSLASEPNMSGCQVKRFLILHKELDADDGELTRTQKVRRGFVAERYNPLISALYDGSDTCDISTEVTFEDGRKGEISATIKICDMALHDNKIGEVA